MIVIMTTFNMYVYINTKKGQTSGPGWEDLFVFTGVYDFLIQVTRLRNFYIHRVFGHNNPRQSPMIKIIDELPLMNLTNH